MKYTTKSQKKSIYSPISPEYSPISADEGTTSHSRRKKHKHHKKRADDREYIRRVYKDERYGRSIVRVERNKPRHDSEKFDCNVRSRSKSSHHKHDRHESKSRKEHKKSDRSRERSKKKCKSKHKKHEKKRRRSTSKSSSSSDSDEDLKSSSFISEILKNKKTKNYEKVLDEVRKTINNELNDESISYTPPLKPGMTKIEDTKSCGTQSKKICVPKQPDKTINKLSLDINGNVSLPSVSKNAQKSCDVTKSASIQAKSIQIDAQKIKISNGNQVTSINKSNNVQKPTVSNENQVTSTNKLNDVQKLTASNVNSTKKKSVLDLPMPPEIDIPIKPSPTQSIKNQQREKSNELVKKVSNSVIVSIPLAKLLDGKNMEPIIAANFENSQLKKGIISHPPEPLPQPKEKPSAADHVEHLKEMQNHLQKEAIFTPFDPKGTPPQFLKPPRPSIVKQPTVVTTKFKNQSFESFKILEQVGKGTYGKVFKAIDLRTDETVAMKYIKVEHETEGFPITCLREIKILRQLDHPNIIKLRDIVFRHEKNSTYLVFDYMNHDLLGLRINKEMDFDEANIYYISKQLLEGINYCHKNQIIHRDLKLSNILMNNKGQVKICDFGLSRMWTVNRPYTNKVISLWYRPIELLLGEEMYGPPVDIWSLGCIIYELFRRRPLFEYSTELEIINAIFNLCGTPEYNMWPEVKKLPKYKTCKPSPRMRNLKNTLYPALPPSAIDLVDQMLALNPAKRISAEDALTSNWVMKMEKAERKPLKLPKTDSLEMRARGLC
jgi:cyclin-dependent kinase 12/13